MESFFSRLEINVLAFFVKLNSSTCSFNVNGGFPLFPKTSLHNTASLVTAVATTFKTVVTTVATTFTTLA